MTGRCTWPDCQAAPDRRTCGHCPLGAHVGVPPVDAVAIARAMGDVTMERELMERRQALADRRGSPRCSLDTWRAKLTWAVGAFLLVVLVALAVRW